MFFRAENFATRTAQWMNPYEPISEDLTKLEDLLDRLYYKSLGRIRYRKKVFYRAFWRWAWKTKYYSSDTRFPSPDDYRQIYFCNICEKEILPGAELQLEFELRIAGRNSRTFRPRDMNQLVIHFLQHMNEFMPQFVKEVEQKDPREKRDIEMSMPDRRSLLKT